MASTITVRQLPAGRARPLIDFPYKLYADNPHWIGMLRRDVAHTLSPRKNPFFEHGEIQPFVATNGRGEVVGTIAAIVNGMHLKKYDDGVGFFGFFECVEDYDVAHALFEHASDWLRSRGLTGVRGPTNPSLNDIAGLLVDGFDREPSLMMPYNPPYYSEYLERYGFERAMTMWAYYVHKKYVQMDKIRRGVDIVKRRNPSLSIRTLDLTRFDAEAKAILEIYNEAWANNWGHVPMTAREFAGLAKMMKQVVDPNIVFIVEDAGVPVAFTLALPDMNKALRHVKDGRLLPKGLPTLLGYAKFGGIYECRNLLMGVMPAYRGRGLDAMMNLELITRGPEHGYDACEMSWVLDSNQVLKNSLDAMGAVVDKQYALFEKTL